jgi:hypothetical protein
VAFELVADGRPDEIRAVRIEPFLHHQIDVTEVDIAKVDRDLLGIRDPGSQHIVGHESIHFCHPTGWFLDVRWCSGAAFKGSEKLV